MHQELIADRYRLLDLVGSGGMGRVWLARDEMLRRDIAIKEFVPPPWLAEAERDELTRRTLREARTAARLNHPNVVRIYDVVHDRDSPWIVMEYVPSRSLQQVIVDDGPLNPTRTARIGLAVLAALRAAHAAGVLHRDVKPHNVLVAEDGRVVLTDFGLATFDGGDGVMTGPGMVLGSPQFVAPERAREGHSDQRSDLWSLGATLFAAVEGKSPYARSSAMATLSALATEPPDPARRAGVLRPVLTGLLQRDPQRRLTAAEAERLLAGAAGLLDGRSDPGSAGSWRSLPAPVLPPEQTPVSLPPEAETDRPRPTDAGRQAGGWQAPAGAAATGTRHRRRWRAMATGRRRVLGAGVAAVLLVGVATGVVLTGEEGGPTRPQARPTGTAGPAPFPCVPPPAAEATARITPGPIPAGEQFALREEWTWYVDPSGFRIAAPVGWLHYTSGATTCFRAPDGSRLLSVAAGAVPAGEPTDHWRAEERRLTRDGDLSGYRLFGINPVEMFRGGAEWECGWVDAAGENRHTARLLLPVSPSRAYTVAWSTREFDWQVYRPYYLMIRQSFRPAP